MNLYVFLRHLPLTRPSKIYITRKTENEPKHAKDQRSPEVQHALERHFIAGIVPGEGVACPSVWLSRHLWYLAIRPSWSGLGRDVRWDPERRWDRARGTLSTETRAAQIARHLASFREWRRFLARTFFARP